MPNYPFILKPLKIESIFQEFPPLPPPQIPSVPILQLEEKPFAPIIPAKPEHPGEFTKLPPRKTAFIPLLFGELGTVLISFLVEAITNSQAVGFAVFGVLTTLISSFGWINYQNYSQRLKEYRQEQMSHKEKVNKYPLLLSDWENKRETQLRNYSQKLEFWEANTVQKRQEHQEEMRKWERKRDELEQIYLRQKEESRTPKKVARWRKQELKQRIVSLRPSPLGNRVDTQRFDPRGYAEFPDNCPFSNLLERYFGSDKIYILHRMNGKIPDFAYIDRVNNLYIDIEIDEPYTPRQYPRHGRQLRVTHCLGQYDYEDRDRLFINSDWFVIHFSERQIICWAESCCKQIAKLIYELIEDDSILNRFNCVSDLQPEPRWTMQEAETMANKQERLRYRRFNNNCNNLIQPRSLDR